MKIRCLSGQNHFEMHLASKMQKIKIFRNLKNLNFELKIIENIKLISKKTIIEKNFLLPLGLPEPREMTDQSTD